MQDQHVRHEISEVTVVNLKNLFKKTGVEERESEFAGQSAAKPEVPHGLLKKCNVCKAAIFTEDVKKAYYICPKCHNYFRVHAWRRIERVADEGSFEEWNTGLQTTNPLDYKGYPEKIAQLQEKTGLEEAVVTGACTIEGQKTALAVCDSRFIMASMGEVVGEKITRTVERATEEGLPVIIFACSGGARMQEGIISLMQMTKTSAALKKHSDAGLLYISVLTNPTTGGVTASFAMLGDIILAEPGALIGFAGPRVIEQTIGQKLPKGFQRAEFLLEHGFIDGIIERENMKAELGTILKLHNKETGVTGSETWNESVKKLLQSHTDAVFSGDSGEAITDSETTQDKNIQSQTAAGSVTAGRAEHTEEVQTGKALSAWDRVLRSRQMERPVGTDYIQRLFADFIEFHGDRYYGDDSAVVGGIAQFHGIPVTVIAQQKGKNTKDNITRNFGMPSPEGYRKALRLMHQAEKFGRPVICFVDTPGAFCGIEAEERGQGEAIARNLYELSSLKVPVLSVVIGEGGSGGALAMAVADEVWMLENSIYSILSPEGFASILWKDSKRAKEAAEVMRLTAADLKQLGIIEQVIPETETYTDETMEPVCICLDQEISRFLQTYGIMKPEALQNHRYHRFRKF